MIVTLTMSIAKILYNLLLNMTKLLNQQSTGIIVLVALFFWDNKKEEEQLAQISRDETLSRLPLRLSTNRVVELVQLRDTVRPVSINTYFIYLFIKSFLLSLKWNTYILQPRLVLGYFSRKEGDCFVSNAECR